MDPQENLGGRSVVNIIANQFATVAILEEEAREELYKIFPVFKQRMQFTNRVLFQLGLVSLERYAEQNDLEVSKESFEKIQIHAISNATKETYKIIIDESLTLSENKYDLSLFIRRCLAEQLFPKTVVENNKFKDTVLVSHIQRKTFDSRGKLVDRKGRNCLDLCDVERNSKTEKTIKILHVINLLYVAFIVPFLIAFDQKMGPVFITGEVISLAISLLHIAMRFRIPVNVRGSDTRQFKEILKRYYNDGLIIDLFGLLPLNLVLGILYSNNVSSQMPMKLRNIIAFLRMVRVLSIFRGLSLIEEFTVQLTSASYLIILVKAFAIWFIIGHLMGCAWFYLNTLIELGKSRTWFNQQGLIDKTVGEQYLRVYYFTLNIGTGIGTGDMLPQNELERLGIICFMTTGVVFFVFGFGLIIYFFSLQRNGNENEKVEQQIRQIHQLGEDKQLFEQRKRIQKYFAFLQYQKQNMFLIDKKELKQNVPMTILQEIVVQTNEQILKVIFKDMQSENLVRELCIALKCKTYLPGDYVIVKGDRVSFVFFIADGTLFMIAQNKKSIVKTMTKGEYFGEIEVIQKMAQRSHYVQAATFCTLNEIRKEKVFKIAAVYPQLLTQLKNTAKEKLEQLKKFTETEREDKNENRPLGGLGISLFKGRKDADNDNDVQEEKLSLLSAVDKKRD